MTLPEPNFIDRDIDTITREWISLYEEKTGKTLQPAQIERLLIDVGVYRENLLRIKVQETAKQNLVNYATYPVLDYLGELVGEIRLQPQKAKTSLRASINETKTFAVNIPANTQVESKDAKVIFSTLDDATILAGQLYVDIASECQTAGIAGNGYLPDEINNIVQTVPYLDGISNIDISAGGADLEDDKSFSERIKLAPEKFTTAGSKGAYEALVKSAHQDIVDVAVIKPQTPATVSYTINSNNYTAEAGTDGTFSGTDITSGTVDYITGEINLAFANPASNISTSIPPTGLIKIYPLTKDGNPSQAIIDEINNIFLDDNKKPLNDEVIIENPTPVDFSIDAEIIVYDKADQGIVQSEAVKILDEYTFEMKSKLGKDIVPAQIISKLLSINGVYNVNLVSPAHTIIEKKEWANNTNKTITITGVVNG